MSMSSDAYYEMLEEAVNLILDDISRWQDEDEKEDSVYDEAYIEGYIDGLEGALGYLRDSLERHT